MALNYKFEVPSNLKLEQYPRIITNFQKYVGNIHYSDLKPIKEALEARENLLRSTELKNLGSNKEEREARFKVLLDADVIYQGILKDYGELEWKIKELGFELEGVINSFKVEMLKRRSAIVQHEIFVGVPIIDAEPF